MFNGSYRQKLLKIKSRKQGKASESNSWRSRVSCGTCGRFGGRIFNRKDTGPVCRECLEDLGKAEDPDYTHPIELKPKSRKPVLVGLTCHDCKEEIPPENDPRRIKWHGKYVCRSCKGRRIVQARLDKKKKKQADKELDSLPDCSGCGDQISLPDSKLLRLTKWRGERICLSCRGRRMSRARSKQKI